jgi:hypothetical protein
MGGAVPRVTAATMALLAPKRLLFIGDSLTYVNDLDQRVATLARAAGFSDGLVVDRVVKVHRCKRAHLGRTHLCARMHATQR